MLRARILVALCGLLLVSASLRAGTLFLVNASGDTAGRIPSLERAEERFIPLTLLALKAGWKSEVVNGLHTVTTPFSTICLRRSNPFLKVNTDFIQLTVAPEEWDGSLWLPVSDLNTIFLPSELDYDSQQSLLRIEHVVTPVKTGHDSQPNGLDSARWTMKTVIIDPGHGGKDSGASGLNGLVEKDVTLDIALRLAKSLQNEGIRAELTRETDSFVPLSERTQFANMKHGDLFISIHINSSSDKTAKGIETYFLKPARTQRAIEVALRENGVVELEEGNADYKELTDQNYILLTMATSQYMKDSEKLAAFSLEQAKKTTGLTVRGVDQAGFYVLIGASMPAILFECGFLTNPGDAAFLLTDLGRQKMADALAESVRRVKVSLEASATK